MVCNKKKRKLVFIKRKWNHVVFSWATILSFHPVEGSYRSWDLYTTGQLVDGLQQKKKTGFHQTKMESCRLFLGNNFIVPPCRRLLPLLGFVHNWPTTRWSATKKENRFSSNENGIMSSFLGWQFYLSTLYDKFWRREWSGIDQHKAKYQ